MTEINNKLVFILLQELGVDKISIEYEGSGDSGAIESVEYLDENEDPIENIPDSYNSAIREAAYILLQDLYHTDWYNNEGGFGTLVINLNDKSYYIDGYYRTMTEEEAFDSGDLSELFTKLEINGTSL